MRPRAARPAPRRAAPGRRRRHDARRAGRRRPGSSAPSVPRTPSVTPPSVGSTGGGSVQPERTPTTTTPAPRPQLALSDIALGAVAVVYAPYASPDLDLGDPSRIVDGSTRSAWKAPAAADPTASPQLGVYVDLATKERVRKLVLQTPTPGIDVEIYGAVDGPPAAITDPGWDHLANRADLAAQTTIKLPDKAYRYFLVWIVGAPPDGARAAISELGLLSLQPE